MERKLYIIKDNILIAVMDEGVFDCSALEGSHTHLVTEQEFEVIKEKEGIDTTAYDVENESINI